MSVFFHRTFQSLACPASLWEESGEMAPPEETKTGKLSPNQSQVKMQCHLGAPFPGGKTQRAPSSGAIGSSPRVG